MSFFSKLFGSNEQEIKKIQPLVDKVNALEKEFEKLGDDRIKHKTNELRDRLKNGETVEDILPEAFAAVREAAKRVIDQRHFDVQLLGGIILHQGKVAEMKTGEGKTLTSTLPIYLNALSGKGVHVVTVNDYLAKRDCNWMGAIYNFLGVSTSCIVHDTAYLYEPNSVDANQVSVEMENLRPITRKEAYATDITYGTNNEYGFDYLRDNMAQSVELMVQRPFNFAIVDEVDSILIDESRTPLIISAPDTQSTQLYGKFSSLAQQLKKEEDYTVDEKLKAVAITDTGITKIEKSLGVDNLYDTSRIQYVHHLEQALKAYAIFEKDRDYVVKDGEIVIVDDFTGRLTPGRRYSEGLHQALEAKEGVAIQRESRTLATITFQNFFRMYDKLSGMTGTALTSAEELTKVYKLDVVEVPTNQSLIRKDLADVIYKTEKGKFHAIVEKIKEINAAGQPVLVGTIAIEKSEFLSTLLKKSGVKHEVLNAKNHEKEAEIISSAGKKAGVTIATNMAGRGTDIKLGDGVKDVGGLFILGTERHEARRIDNQLRGRAGRQGDPGVSQFFVSLEDELLRRFGGDKLKGMMDTLGLPEDQPIQNKLISKQIENAQSKIEGFNFDMRKHVLQYDDVMNKQREVIYKKRRDILEKENIKPLILENLSEETEDMVSSRCVGDDPDWEIDELVKDVQGELPLEENEQKEVHSIADNTSLDSAQKKSKLHEYIFGIAKRAYNQKEQELQGENLRKAEKTLYLRTIDMMWMNHLDEIDYMRQGIGLRGYGQRDPLIEYKKEAFTMFSGLVNSIRHNVLSTLFKLELSPNPAPQSSDTPNNLQYSGPAGPPAQFSAMNANNTSNSSSSSASSEQKKQKPTHAKKQVGRNEPCPCGNGKKYKKCHGK